MTNPNVTLVPLNDAEYADFAQRHLLEYARQHVTAGEWTKEEAPARAQAELTELFDDSLRPTGHVFLKGLNAQGQLIGWLWVAPAPPFLGENRARKRWLSQITVDESHRRCGYGLAMLRALHRQLAAQDVEELWLRVYDWNEEARRLYERAGYELARKFPTDAHYRICFNAASETA